MDSLPVGPMDILNSPLTPAKWVCHSIKIANTMSIVTVHCHCPLSLSIVTVLCPLSTSTVYVHCPRPLSTSTSTVHCRDSRWQRLQVAETLETLRNGLYACRRGTEYEQYY